MSRRTGKHRIYMNVGYDLSEQQLREFFNQFGNVTDVYLPKHKSGRNKGFGFTTFDCEDGLRSALAGQQYLVGGDMVKINRAGPRPEHELLEEEEQAASAAIGNASSRQPQLFGKGPRLYVGGVPNELTEERLKAHFSRWGNVVDLYFPGKKGQSRVNYCFVTFDNWRAAQRACNQSERSIDGMPLQSINLAQERSAEQELQATAEEAAAAASKPNPPAAPSFGTVNSGPSLALLQHFQAQAQMQAQQLGAVGYGGQPQLPQHLSSMIAAQDTAGLAASMAAYPDAYHQLLTGMLAQQSMAAAGQNPMLLSVPAAPVAAPASHVQPPSALNAYGVPCGQSPMGQYPQGLGSMSIDMTQFVAARLAAAAAAGNNEHIGDHRMLQSSGVKDSLGVHIPHSMQGVPSGNSLAAGMTASNWGWGSATDMQGMESSPEMYLAPQAQFLNAQQGLGAAAGFHPMAGLPLPSGVLHLEGFGPCRTSIGRRHKLCMPY